MSVPGRKEHSAPETAPLPTGCRGRQFWSPAAGTTWAWRSSASMRSSNVVLASTTWRSRLAPGHRWRRSMRPRWTPPVSHSRTASGRPTACFTPRSGTWGPKGRSSCLRARAGDAPGRLGIYGTLHAALNGLALAAAVELAPLRVNAISPGGIGIGRTRQLIPHAGEARDFGAMAVALMVNPAITGVVVDVEAVSSWDDQRPVSGAASCRLPGRVPASIVTTVLPGQGPVVLS
jgi:NAD(P)-dependent dehydrogenase (short-subunit alcohol dehydrogenase family)